MNEPLKKGDYVLATKFSDGDPGDHWCVGFYDRQETFGSPDRPDVRHFVVDSDGKQFRGGSGFRRVGVVASEYGRWLLSAAKVLEAAPPGTVNLWTMMTEHAAKGESHV